MTGQLHKRLERLEALLAARVAPPIWRWLPRADMDAVAELERLVTDGEVAEKDKDRVRCWRWLTHEEAIARGMEVIDSPPGHMDPITHCWVRDDRPAQPQLPGPAPMLALPAPAAPAPDDSPWWWEASNWQLNVQG